MKGEDSDVWRALLIIFGCIAMDQAKTVIINRNRRVIMDFEELRSPVKQMRRIPDYSSINRWQPKFQQSPNLVTNGHARPSQKLGLDHRKKGTYRNRWKASNASGSKNSEEKNTGSTKPRYANSIWQNLQDNSRKWNNYDMQKVSMWPSKGNKWNTYKQEYKPDSEYSPYVEDRFGSKNKRPPYFTLPNHSLYFSSRFPTTTIAPKLLPRKSITPRIRATTYEGVSYQKLVTWIPKSMRHPWDTSKKLTFGPWNKETKPRPTKPALTFADHEEGKRNFKDTMFDKAQTTRQPFLSKERMTEYFWVKVPTTKPNFLNKNVPTPFSSFQLPEPETTLSGYRQGFMENSILKSDYFPTIRPSTNSEYQLSSSPSNMFIVTTPAPLAFSSLAPTTSFSRPKYKPTYRAGIFLTPTYQSYINLHEKRTTRIVRETTDTTRVEIEDLDVEAPEDNAVTDLTEMMELMTNNLQPLFENSLIMEEMLERLAALITLVGLPAITGLVSLLGAGPALVILIAWLLPAVVLLTLPGVATV